MNMSMDRSSSDNGEWIPVVKKPRSHVQGIVNHRYQEFHTLFVVNLPMDVGIVEIRILFKDVFIPLKRSKVIGNKFGFVRYDYHVSADVAILKANVTIEESSFRKVESSNFLAVIDHEDQISQVPEETQSLEMGTEENPNDSSLKSTQDLESFVEDSLGLQSLFHEIHVVDPVEKTRSHISCQFD
ncbi:hypothetical protein Vadar_004019 [Vaccinium darrowii]|uniref:Uncharacterized protein n=1 Tax=Vaccinium darrowii TaxID=229202 RepID=A0ACB7X7E6_9ERIC|nr:hypothetical protein Vadar_004019 [Vaccinium darrowii]